MVKMAAAFAADAGTGEQPVAPTDGNATQRAFGDIVVDLEPTTAEEAGERGPALGTIDDGLGHHRLGRQATKRIAECGSTVGDQRCGAILPRAASHIGRLPTHIGLDGIERADTFEDIGRQPGRLGLMNIEDLAPEMRPAGNLGHAPAQVELVISGKGIGLEMATETGELGLRMRACAIRANSIPNGRNSSRSASETPSSANF